MVVNTMGMGVATLHTFLFMAMVMAAVTSLDMDMSMRVRGRCMDGTPRKKRGCQSDENRENQGGTHVKLLRVSVMLNRHVCALERKSQALEPVI